MRRMSRGGEARIRKVCFSDFFIFGGNNQESVSHLNETVKKISVGYAGKIFLPIFDWFEALIVK